MTLRALIVLLAMLNLGVAAWWLLRPDAPLVAVEDAPSGIARLQLVSERPANVRPAPAAAPAPSPGQASTAVPPPPATATAAVAEPVPPAAAERCIRFGPFADPQALATAQAALRPFALRLKPRTASRDSGRGWRVYLPAAADRAAATESAAKLKAAGFNDLLVVTNGAEANSVALGRFSSEARAQQHAQALRAAGFEAKAEPLGEIRSEGWLDAAVAADADLAAARRASGAAQSRPVDCAGLR